MSEAHARMHLRAVVSTDDVDMGVRVLLESFLGTQKYGVQKRLQKVSALAIMATVTVTFIITVTVIVTVIVTITVTVMVTIAVTIAARCNMIGSEVRYTCR